MNPFMMMFGPMGMSFTGGCCSGMYMPYYGQNDMLTFMNFPIFRNTGSDYLLDPRLALQQTQFSIQNGSIFGNSYLPMFNNFPGVTGIGAPWWQTNTKPETEEEKKKREAKEAEAKKPEAQKAKSLKESFDKIKKLAETHKNFLNLDDSIIKKADEAMKKETAEEQLKAMKEVMSLIPADIIRKSVIADDEVVKKLKEAGYNFNYSNNAYSLPVASITNNMNDVHDNIISKKDYTALGTLASDITGKRTPILAAISTWNNTQNEKGILKFIAENLPAETDASIAQLKLIVPQIINGLIDKADEYSGCAKIKADRDALAKLKDGLLADFSSENLKKVSNAFEKLYARLRMQEAVQVREYIKGRNDFKAINEVKDGIINENMIVAETYENLTKEGIANPPKETGLDKIQAVTTVTVTDEGVVDRDKEYENNKQGLIDEYLAKDNKYLTKVGDTNVYQTIGYDENGSGAKYYTVKDNKIIEVKKKGDGTFEAVANAPEVKSSDIVNYDSTLRTVKSLIGDNLIEPYKGQFVVATLPYPVFKGTSKKTNEFYAIIDGVFGKIKNCTNLKEDKTNKLISAVGTQKTLDKLTADDLDTNVDAEKIKSEELDKKEEKKTKDKNEAERISKITKEVYSFKTIDSQLAEAGLEKTAVIGFYKTKDEPTLFFRYDDNINSKTYQHIVQLKNVEAIYEDGTMKIKGSKVKEACKEVQAPVDCAKELQTVLNTTVYQNNYNCEKYRTAEQIKNDLNLIRRKMNSFKRYTQIDDIKKFFNSYQDAAYHWWKPNDLSLCKAICNVKIIPESDKKEYIKLIAYKMKQIVDKKQITFDNPDDYAMLEYIKNGHMVSNGSGITLDSTASELDRIVEQIMEKI